MKLDISFVREQLKKKDKFQQIPLYLELELEEKLSEIKEKTEEPRFIEIDILGQDK